MKLSEEKIKRIVWTLGNNRRPQVPDEIWHEMFKEYNTDNNANLFLKCSVCYLKVAKYLKQKYGII